MNDVTSDIERGESAREANRPSQIRSIARLCLIGTAFLMLAFFLTAVIRVTIGGRPLVVPNNMYYLSSNLNLSRTPQSLRLVTIYFENGSSVISKEQVKVLELLGIALKRCGDAAVTIIPSTSSSAFSSVSKRTNLILASERAESIGKVLEPLLGDMQVVRKAATKDDDLINKRWFTDVIEGARAREVEALNRRGDVFVSSARCLQSNRWQEEPS